MTFGIKTEGFRKKRFDDIKNDLENRFLSTFGDINLTPDSVFGQLIGILSKVVADQWDTTEQIYYAMYRNSAEGVSLDNSLQLVGIFRLEETSTVVTAALKGLEGTNIPEGTQAQVQGTGDIFVAQSDSFITASKAVKAVINIDAVANSQSYVATVNLVNHAYTSDANATQDEIGNGIAAVINGGSEPVTASYANGSGKVELVTDDFEDTFNLIVGDRLSISDIESNVVFVAQNPGQIEVPINTLTQITTPVSGWNSITNYLTGITGRETETDAELRLRALSALRVAGAATVEAIKARLLQEVQSVTGVTIFENRTMVTDSNGLPPKSFECIVSGGSDQAVADKIWEVKPAGIETHGNILEFVQDSGGIAQPIRFSRATPIYIWLQANITLYSEEDFPNNGLTQIKEQMLRYGNSLGVGDDVILQRFFGFIFQVPGVSTIDLSVATSTTETGPAGTYSTSNLAIEAREIAQFDIDRIGVTIV